MLLTFEWDPEKALENERKHGVTFEEASTSFADIGSLTVLDPDHSESEDRYVLLGMSANGRLLVVFIQNGVLIFASSVPAGQSREAANTRTVSNHGDHYDFSNGVRGRYAKRLRRYKCCTSGSRRGQEFPDLRPVNKALRQVLRDKRSAGPGTLPSAPPVA